VLCSLQRQLEALDAVLLTERLQDGAAWLAHLAKWYFWDTTRKDRIASHARPDVSAAAAAALPPGDTAVLQALTALDARLYAHAARLAGDVMLRGATAPTRRPLRRCEQLEEGGQSDGAAAAGAGDAADVGWGEGWAPLSSGSQKHT
jgi:hypothetical protein